MEFEAETAKSILTSIVQNVVEVPVKKITIINHRGEVIKLENKYVTVDPKKMKGFINKKRMTIEIEMEEEEEVMIEEDEKVTGNPAPGGFISTLSISKKPNPEGIKKAVQDQDAAFGRKPSNRYDALVALLTKFPITTSEGTIFFYIKSILKYIEIYYFKHWMLYTNFLL